MMEAQGRFSMERLRSKQAVGAWNMKNIGKLVFVLGTRHVPRLPPIQECSKIEMGMSMGDGKHLVTTSYVGYSSSG